MLRITFFILFMVFFGSAMAQELADFKWLQGKWESDNEGYTIIEQWAIRNDSTLVGNSEIRQNEELLFGEELSLDLRADGVFYTAILPSKTARFRLTSWNEGSFTVSDPENDFPTTISYALTKDGLLITLDGIENGVQKNETFLMVKN